MSPCVPFVPVEGVRPIEAAPEGARRAQRLLSVLAFLTVGAATAGGWALATEDAEQETAQVADALAAEASASLENVVGRAVDGLRGAGAIVEADGSIDRAAFRTFAGGLLTDEALGIALGVPVTAAGREDFEAIEAPIVVVDARGEFVAAPRQALHYPLVDVVSTDRDVGRVRGYDYASDPVRRAALEQARDQGSAALSAPTELRPYGETGFVVIEPLYRPGADTTSAAGRRQAFVGFLTVAYTGQEVLDDLSRVLPAGTGVSIRDGETALFRATGTGGADAAPFARTQAVMVPGRTWQLHVVPAAGPSKTAATYLLVGGVGVELALVLLFGSTWRYQRRLRRAYASQRVSHQRSETLEGLAARLSRSLSGTEVGEALLEQLPPFTGTTAGAVLVLDDDGEHLELIAADGYTEEQELAIRQVPLAAPSTVADVVRSGQPAWLPSPLAWRDDPVTASLAGAGRAAAVVPLVADRAVVGLLVLVHPGVRGFYEDERSLLLTVGALAARALNRARRYDAEHDAAVVLQRALLPSQLPTVDGVGIAVRYLPATDGLAVGGDWYDVFAVGDGRTAVVVGDVVGRGIKAAAAMGRIRSALRALSEVLPDPAELLRAFEVHVPTIPDALCATMVYAVLDPAHARLTYVRAGHPPPLLLRVGSEPRLLDDVVSPPLGVTGGAPVRTGTVPVEPGDTIVLYTDGVVERRGEAVTVGLERLRVVGRDVVGLDVDDCADRIVEAMLGNEAHGDDAAVVAVRLLAAPTGEGTEVRAPTTTAVTGR